MNGKWKLTADQKARLGLQGDEEPVDIMLVDRIALLKGATPAVTNTFFNRTVTGANATWQSNMTRPGQLPEGWAAILMEMYYRVFADTVISTAAEAIEMWGNRQLLQEIGGMFTFKVGTDKEYGNGIPTSIIPSGPSVSAIGSGPALTVVAAGNGTGHIGNHLGINLDLAKPNTQFQAVLDYSKISATAVGANLDLWLEVVLRGPGKRGVH